MEFDNSALGHFLHNMSQFGAFEFEKNFNADKFLIFAANNYIIPGVALAIYLSFCFGVRRIMEGRQAFDLRTPLAIWNAMLSGFSFLGMCRTVPFLLGSIFLNPYKDTICIDPRTSWGHGPTGLWVMLFIFSKLPELVDTVFIVLRKRPLIFLHWYHHVTVLLFCWNAYATLAGTGLYFVAMNYSVHALMYGYYCLTALHLCPKSFPTILITLSQIAQMFVGTGVCCSAWYYWYIGNTCHNDITNLIAGGIMYGSYLYLFTAFAFRRYAPRKPKTLDDESQSKKEK
eukprot:GSChrysophyteH2.ASY1.ANO1.261.1 assembled CDS